MSRSVVLLIVVLVALAAGLYLLAGRASERPQTQVEKSVTLGNLT